MSWFVTLTVGIGFGLLSPGAPGQEPERPKTKISFAESLGIRMVPIRSGDFLMGSTKDQVELAKKQFPKSGVFYFIMELPQHRVKIAKLAAMSAHEITVGQFGKFVEATGYRTDAEKDGMGGHGYDAEKNVFRRDPKFRWKDLGFPQTENHPVVNVSWNDAAAFTKWLSAKEGVEYRLPTEAEWEYCCRAGSETLFFCGDDPEGLAKHGNVMDVSGAKIMRSSYGDPLAADDGQGFTAPVGSYRANAFGLYDMHGNVGEWCLDGLDAAFYAESPPTDPVFISEAAPHRSYRGGGWNFPAGRARSAFRFGGPPGYRNFYLGFRIAQVRSGS